MRTLKRIAIPLAIGALAAGLFAWLHGPEESTAPATADQAATAYAPAQAHMQARPAAQTPDEPPLRVQVERLLATHDPRDAYRAYWLVADCIAFNTNNDRIIFDEGLLEHPRPGSVPGMRGMTDEEKRHDARLCADMTERERQSRLDYLAVAARAGLAGSALAFMNEGPFGDPSALQTRPGDPLVKEWKATATALLAKAAEDADWGALDYLRFNLAHGSDVVEKNPALAFRYGMARGMIYADLLGADDMMAKLTTQQATQAVEAAEGFSPERREAELAAARRIAELARARRAQAKDKAAPRA